MTIRTIAVKDTAAVNFNPNGERPNFYASERYAWIKNKSSGAMYASLKSDVGSGVFGSAEIAANEFVCIELDGTNKLYISGNGNAEIITTTAGICPFKKAPAASGGGGNETGLITLSGMELYAETGLYSEIEEE